MIDIYCGDCGASGSVGKVTAGLRCRCGSTNLGLDGVDNVKTAVFSDEHVTRYVDWAKQRKYDPDEVETLQRYEREPGIGRAHTNYLADQLYIGGGDQDWRRSAVKSYQNQVEKIPCPNCGSEDAEAQHWEQVVNGHSRHMVTRSCPDCGDAVTTRVAAGGTGWVGPDPRRLDGWSEYQGPVPQTAYREPPVADSQVCPVCKGTGYDVIDKTQCRECGGTGYITHPTQGQDYNMPPTLDPGRALPEGGAHLVTGSLSSTDIYRMADGDRHTVGDHEISYRAEQAMGDNGLPARGYTVGGYLVEHPESGKYRYFPHSPYKPDSWAGLAKSYAADQAIDYLNREQRQRRQGGLTATALAKLAGRPSTDPLGSVEEHLLATSPDYRRPTAPAGSFNPDDARTFYPKADVRSPHLKTWTPAQAPTGPYVMNEASCPNCGTRPTELRKDKNEDAWWYCPHCQSSLANIDRNPQINPYAPPEGFEPDRSMKTSGFLRRNQKTGRLLKMLAAIHERNELDAPEALALARTSLQRYREH